MCSSDSRRRLYREQLELVCGHTHHVADIHVVKLILEQGSNEVSANLLKDLKSRYRQRDRKYGLPTKPILLADRAFCDSSGAVAGHARQRQPSTLQRMQATMANSVIVLLQNKILVLPPLISLKPPPELH